MTVSVRTYPLWCLGLEADDEACVRACAGHDYVVERLTFDLLPDEAGDEVPALLWLGRDAWLRLTAEPGRARIWKRLPRVLMLPPDCPREELLKALADGFQNVFCGPLSPERAHEALGACLEQSNLYRDMDRMAREILLNRELLIRKSDVLAFILRFVRDLVPDACGRAAYGMGGGGGEESFSVFALLREVRSCLAELLPVRAVHAAFCRWAGDGSRLLELRVDARDKSSAGKDWAAFLLSALQTVEGVHGDTRPGAKQKPMQGTEASGRADAAGHSAGPCRIATLTRRLIPVEDGGRSASGNFPITGVSPERTLVLPLAFPPLAPDERPGAFDGGVLVIELERECALGRDLALALDAAMNHLTWVLSRAPLELPEEAFSPSALPSPSHLVVNQ